MYFSSWELQELLFMDQKKMRKFHKLYSQDDITVDKIKTSLAGYNGHLNHGKVIDHHLLDGKDNPALQYDDFSAAKEGFYMPVYVLTSFLIYAVVNAFTPGPGNTLALNTVINYGWKKGEPLFLGIFTGYYVVQIICALFVYGVGTFLPDALQVMKYIGAAYILWLAIHIAISKPEVREERGSTSLMKGFLLQFVNVKIYMFGITALTGFITPYSTALWVLIGFELLIATIGTIATVTWIGAGLLIQKFYINHYRMINIILAMTLLECIWSMLKK